MPSAPLTPNDLETAVRAWLKLKLCGDLSATPSIRAGLEFLNFATRQVEPARPNSRNLGANVVGWKRIMHQRPSPLRVHVTRWSEIAIHMTAW